MLCGIKLKIVFFFVFFDNLRYLLRLGFSYLIAPFKWPFILIPNLPLDLIKMIESPVPFLIGILGDEKSYEETLKRENIEADILFIYSKGIKYKVKINKLN